MTFFYVYEHIRNDTGECFYIGKGTKYRHSSKDGRSKYWHNIVNKFGYKYNIIADKLTENEAFAFEKAIIKSATEQKIKLCNLTTGGEGISGYKHTEEAKRKISQIKQTLFGEKNPRFKGIVLATCLKTGKTIELHGKKDTINKNFCYKHVNHCINGKRKTHKGYTFKRIASHGG